MLLDMRTDVRTVPPAEDEEHFGDVPVRRRWVQSARRPASMIWSIQMPAGNKATDKCPPACGHGKDRPAVRDHFLQDSLNEADMFVSASDNNVKLLVEHNWMFRIEARTCKCEWTYQ